MALWCGKKAHDLFQTMSFFLQDEARNIKNLGGQLRIIMLTLGTLLGTLLHKIKEPHLCQYQVRIWACSGTTSHWKGSWAFID